MILGHTFSSLLAASCVSAGVDGLGGDCQPAGDDLLEPEKDDLAENVVQLVGVVGTEDPKERFSDCESDSLETHT